MLIIMPIINVPITSNAITPKTKIPTNKIQKLISLMNLSRIAPIMNATTGYNSKNPAEGPANTPMPPRPPDNNGKPATTNNKKTITLNVPYLRPKITPAKKIPMF